MDEKFQQARENIILGDVETGQHILAQALREDPENEDGWILMASIQALPDRKRECLERVLQINPENEQAWRMLGEVGREEISQDAHIQHAQPFREDEEIEPQLELESEPLMESAEATTAAPAPVIPAAPAVQAGRSTAARQKPSKRYQEKPRRWGMTESQLMILEIFGLVIVLSVLTLVLLLIWSM